MNRNRIVICDIPLPGIVGLVIAVIVSDLFLGDIDIGPVSMRIYLLTIALIISTWMIINRRITFFASRLSAIAFILYGLFIAWAMFNDLFRGAGLGEVVRNIGSTLLFGWLLFAVVQIAINNRTDLVLVTKWFAGTALLSGGFAVLQWAGFEPADAIGDLLRPEDDVFVYARGLSLFSVSLSYHLLAGGALTVGLVLWASEANLKTGIAGIGILSLLYIAVWITLARSAIGAGLIAVAIFAIAGLFIPIGGTTRRTLVPLLLGVPILLTLLIVLIVPGQAISVENPEFTARYDLGRAADSSILTRKALTKWAWRAWRESPIIGNSGGYLDLAYPEGVRADTDLPEKPSAPHNMFMNSLVFYGAIGTFLLAAFLMTAFVLAIRIVVRNFRVPIQGPIAVAALIGLIAFCLNAQFHNESFVSGSSLGFLLMAFLVGVERTTRDSVTRS